MIIDVLEESQPALAEYARIPIGFEVREVADVAESVSHVGRFVLEPRAIAQPYVKDYDDDGGPEAWPSRFDLSYWRFFAARVNGSRVGGAAVILRAPGVEMLRGRDDVAILWDIRVALSFRGQGVGSALVAAVEA